jgi:uncharacterized membrane protein YjgN (DUF898 family)
MSPTGGYMTFLKLLNFVLVFFPSIKLYHAHHDNIGAAVFVAMFVALVYVDVQGLPFYALDHQARHLRRRL